MNDDLERILEPTEEVDRIPPRNGDEPRIRPGTGFSEEFRSIDARQLLATEDGVRVYLRDMAKTRLVSRAEELDLAYRIVSLRARFQALLFQSRPAVLETAPAWALSAMPIAAAAWKSPAPRLRSRYAVASPVWKPPPSAEAGRRTSSNETVLLPEARMPSASEPEDVSLRQ